MHGFTPTVCYPPTPGLILTPVWAVGGVAVATYILVWGTRNEKTCSIWDQRSSVLGVAVGELGSTWNAGLVGWQTKKPV